MSVTDWDDATVANKLHVVTHDKKKNSHEPAWRCRRVHLFSYKTTKKSYFGQGFTEVNSAPRRHG